MTREEKRAREAYRVAQFSAPVHPALEAHGRAASPPALAPAVANRRLAADIERAAEQHHADTLRAQNILQSNVAQPDPARAQTALQQPPATPTGAGAEQSGLRPGQERPAPLFLPAPVFTYPHRSEPTSQRAPAPQHSSQAGSPTGSGACTQTCTTAVGCIVANSTSVPFVASLPGARPGLNSPAHRPAVSSSGARFGSSVSPAQRSPAAAQHAGAAEAETPVMGGLAAQRAFPGTAIAVQQAWRSPSAPAQPAEASHPSGGADISCAAGGEGGNEASTTALPLAPASGEPACTADEALTAAVRTAAATVVPDSARVVLHFDVDAMYAQVCLPHMRFDASREVVVA